MMITTIYQDGKEIVVPSGAHKGDIVIVNGKKYKVITKDGYSWGFEEVDE